MPGKFLSLFDTLGTVKFFKIMLGGTRFFVYEMLFEGSNAIIYSGYDTIEGCKVAIKWAPDGRQLMTEARVLSQIEFPEIIRLIASGRDGQYLVFPLAHTDMIAFACQNGRIEERLVKKTIYRIATALAYLHGIGIVHNDVKPDNILIMDAEYKGDNVVLADFGLAQSLDNGETLRGAIGTEAYASPEKINGQAYNEKSDIWALGVTMAIFLFNEMPFGKDARQEICAGLPHIQRCLHQVSPECGDLLLRMLDVDPNNRISASDILAHPWFADILPVHE